MKKLYLLLIISLFTIFLTSCVELPSEQIIGNAPEITGLSPLNVTIGQSVDLFTNVLGNDLEDGDLTNSIEINNLNELPIFNNTFSFSGTYQIEYILKDSDSNTVTYYRTLNVSDTSLNCISPDESLTLTFCDDFDTAENPNSQGVDLNKWAFQLGNGQQYGIPGWGNNESQYYQENNAFVQDSMLHIEAKLEEVSGYRYTSSRMYTKGLFSQTYGRFEARISLPIGDGLWPAFWLLPENSPYGGWAASGEIDIMEARGRLPLEASGALHFGGAWPNNTYDSETYRFPRNISIQDFNVYAIEWRENSIKWYYNDVLFYEFSDWFSTNGAYPAPFNTDFHMILNVAIGGVYDGNILPPDSLFNNPVYMKVDYVRVFSFNE